MLDELQTMKGMTYCKDVGEKLKQGSFSSAIRDNGKDDGKNSLSGGEEENETGGLGGDGDLQRCVTPKWMCTPHSVCVCVAVYYGVHGAAAASSIRA